MNYPFSKPSLALFAFLLLSVGQLNAMGIYRDGLNAESSALAGVNVLGVNSPIAIMTGNPAGLVKVDQSVTEVNLSLASFDTSFSNAANTNRSSSIEKGAIPAAAYIHSPDESGFTWGISLTPDVALETDYRLVDPAGGLAGVSYGTQKHASKFVALRFAAAGAVSLTDRFDLGASVGLIWNENALESPYIFQSQAPSILPGFKTLLDLQTEGWGWAVQLGINYQLAENLDFGLSYKPETRVAGSGRASGNAAEQLDQLGVTDFRPDFSYRTEVNTRIPAVVSAGLEWQVSPTWTLLAQYDFIKSSTYDNLRIDLSRGNNSDLNGLLGADGFVEVAPLQWDDQRVIRVAATYQLNDGWLLRGGVARTSSPIPSATLTPLTAAISENIYSLGFSREIDGSRLDIGYQYVEESEQRVITSGLLAGEYSNSQFSLSGHWINLSWQF